MKRPAERLAIFRTGGHTRLPQIATKATPFATMFPYVTDFTRSMPYSPIQSLVSELGIWRRSLNTSEGNVPRPWILARYSEFARMEIITLSTNYKYGKRYGVREYARIEILT